MNNFFNSKLRSTKPATSLLVGLGLTTIIVLVSLGVTTVVVSAIRESANVTGANQAYYAAEGALEKGLLVNLDKSAGYTTSSTAVFSKPPQSSYSIQGVVSDNSKQKYSDGYGIPSPGTGNVGTDCDSLNPVVSGDFWYEASEHKYYYSGAPSTAAKFDAKEHPCNWGKLKVGDTVTIPLYYTDTYGTPVNIFKSGSTMSLKLRTGCTDGNPVCSTRPNLDTTKGDKNYNYDDPIVSWQIVGQSPKGDKTFVLGPYINYNSSTKKWYLNSSILSEGKINAKKTSGFDLINLDTFGKDAKGCRDKIRSFLLNLDATLDCLSTPTNWSTQNITKPVLKLSVLHSLDELGGSKIPYMEYQIITDNTITPPPTDTTQTVKAEGYSGSFKQVLQVKNPQETGLLEYVIQQ